TRLTIRRSLTLKKSLWLTQSRTYLKNTRSSTRCIRHICSKWRTRNGETRKRRESPKRRTMVVVHVHEKDVTVVVMVMALRWMRRCMVLVTQYLVIRFEFVLFYAMERDSVKRG